MGLLMSDCPRLMRVIEGCASDEEARAAVERALREADEDISALQNELARALADAQRPVSPRRRSKAA